MTISEPQPCSANATQLHHKIQALDQKIEEMTRYRNKLYQTLTDCLDDCATRCQIEQSLKRLTD